VTVNCPNCESLLPADARYCSACGAQVPTAGSVAAGAMSTGGGAYIAGAVQTGGGAFIGRDSAIYGGYNVSEGVSGAELTKLFEAVYGRIAAHAADPDADVDMLRDTAGKIEQEAARGEQADSSKIRRWLATLGKVAPDVLEVVVNVLTNPGAAVASGVRLVADAFRSG